jgi:type I restriction enzyme S subunit
MKRYEKYKDSTIEWVGEIPEHWEKKKLKYLTSLREELIDYAEFKVAVENIESGTGKLVNMNDEINYQGLLSAFKKGDIIFNKLRPYLHKVYFAKKDGGLFGELLVIYSREELIPEFLFYKFFSKPFIDIVDSSTQGTKMPRANWSDFINQLLIHFPKDKQEQTTIANCLDEKTTQIDNLIIKKQKLIELLKEERTTVINEAVSEKGKNWPTVKFNHYIRLRHGYQFMNYDFTSTGIKVVKITQLSPNGSLDLSEATYIDESRLYEFNDILINEGDILMALTGGTIGKIIRVEKVEEPLLQNYRVGNFFPANDKISKDYLFWVLSSEMILSQIFYEQRETGQPNIGKENFNSFIIPLPPKEEQPTIVKHIQEETQKIDDTVFKIEQEIRLMQEYRTALISEVVTGKIDVRQLAVNKPKKESEIAKA